MAGAPGVEAAFERVRVVAEGAQLERHTGAGLFVASGAVGNDLAGPLATVGAGAMGFGALGGPIGDLVG